MASPYVSAVSMDPSLHSAGHIAIDQQPAAPACSRSTCVEAINEDAGGGGASYTQADEILVEVNPDGALRRCVLFQGMLLTELGDQHAVGMYEYDDGDGYVRVLPGGSFPEARGGEAHRVHVVDMQGEEQPFVLVVTVREEDARIVTVEMFT